MPAIVVWRAEDKVNMVRRWLVAQSESVADQDCWNNSIHGHEFFQNRVRKWNMAWADPHCFVACCGWITHSDQMTHHSSTPSQPPLLGLSWEVSISSFFPPEHTNSGSRKPQTKRTVLGSASVSSWTPTPQVRTTSQCWTIKDARTLRTKAAFPALVSHQRISTTKGRADTTK